jgi:hypothetical protein
VSRLQRIEDLLARRVERIFRPSGALTADLLARELRRAVDRAAVEILEKTFAPNRVTARLSPADYGKLEGLMKPLLDECEGFLEKHFRREGYATIGRIELAIEGGEKVKSGEILVELAYARLEDQERERPRPEPERPVHAGHLTGESGLRIGIPHGTTVLGRGIEADILLDDETVSRKHARLTVRGDRLEVEDLGSRNGIRFRGREVDQAVLEPGDRIGIGEVILRWEP